MLRTSAGTHKLRIWAEGDWPTGQPNGTVAFEWLGQVGHPTSYVLLGGTPSPVSSIAIDTDGRVFPESPAGRGDIIAFGLPPEYGTAVERVLEERGGARGLTVSLAAHGQLGSSVVAFRAGAIFLLAIASRVAVMPDEEVWAEWRSAIAAAAA